MHTHHQIPGYATACILNRYLYLCAFQCVRLSNAKIAYVCKGVSSSDNRNLSCAHDPASEPAYIHDCESDYCTVSDATALICKVLIIDLIMYVKFYMHSWKATFEEEVSAENKIVSSAINFTTFTILMQNIYK